METNHTAMKRAANRRATAEARRQESVANAQAVRAAKDRLAIEKQLWSAVIARCPKCRAEIDRSGRCGC